MKKLKLDYEPHDKVAYTVLAHVVPIVIFVSIIIIGFVVVGCAQHDANQTPVAADFNIGELTVTFDGTPKEVSITPKAGKSTGDITIHYSGTLGNVYARSRSAPSAVGHYNVTFDVAAADGFNAVNGLSAGILEIEEDSGGEPNPPPPIGEPETELKIHFMELGNKYTGDSIYIQYGDIDILIDAGSKTTSAATIKAYINKHIKDNKLEYVIATHAHEDHIAAFNGASGVLAAYQIGTIIDFPNTDSTTATYNNYKTARANAIAKGAKHYTALQCFKNQDGAQRTYTLGEGVTLEILYNYYYENKVPNSGSENDYSVGVRIVQDGNSYVFTGDMEKASEDRLVDYYAANFGGLGRAVLWKGGHHGSVTSGNDKLMSALRPEYICLTTCVGSTEYTTISASQFPSQNFINRVAPYTDKVYATTRVPDYANNKFEPLNGNIVFSASNGNFAINCSNNNLKLKETQWFISNRTMPAAWK